MVGLARPIDETPEFQLVVVVVVHSQKKIGAKEKEKRGRPFLYFLATFLRTE